MTVTSAQIETYQRYCENVGEALLKIVFQAEKLGMARGLSIGALIGSVAAICAAEGLERENVIAALNSAWDDTEIAR